MEAIIQKGLEKNTDYEAAYALDKEKREFERDMGWFGKYCFPKALAKETPPFHRDIYKQLKNDDTKRVLIAAKDVTTTPTTKDKVLINNIVHQIITVDTTEAAGIAITFILIKLDFQL